MTARGTSHLLHYVIEPDLAHRRQWAADHRTRRRARRRHRSDQLDA